MAAGLGCENVTETGRALTSVPQGTTTGEEEAPVSTGTTTGGSGTSTGGGSSTTTGAATTGGIPSGFVPSGPPQTFGAARGISVMTADTNLCVTLLSNFTVVLAVCDGSAGQRWELAQGAVRSLSGNVCLDISGGVAADNQALVAPTCAASGASATQQWNFVAGTLLSSSTDFTAAATSTCIALAGAAGQGAGLVVHTRLRSCQHFVLGYDGAHVTLDAYNNLCMDSSGGGQVHLANCADGQASQLWSLSGAGELRQAGSNQCMAVYQGSFNEGTPAVMAGCSGNAAQSWVWGAADSALRPYAATGGANPTVLGPYNVFNQGSLVLTQQQPHGTPYTVSR